ncbi:EAL domain-containing protein [Methylonatrum kenyense]|uniref:putative bifunctional diguanylate cyclase/phosphodiesterase n=1 Tax=Methylonatrum kenyense TaxID=455253 RepID=UPI0020BD762D|nr:GGDEF domain-containing phosphodiesterase [Methylonatrum kenyense]MCK8515100.1 EAL domain-containing protein [Methylonatrum kenyense]
MNDSSGQGYERLFKANPQPMFVYDLETLQFLDVNNAAVARYGYSRDEFLAMTIRDIRPVEDVPALLENVRNVTDGFDAAGIWRHLLKDGRTILVEISSHSVDFAGRAAELVLAQDVTDRTEWQAAVTESEERLRLALEAAQFGTFDWDVVRDRLIWSPQHEKLWGYQPGEFDGNFASFASRIHPDDMPALEEAIDAAFRSGKRYQHEHRVVHPDGRIVWIAGWGEFRRNPNGDLERMVGVVQDISGRRRREAEIRRLAFEDRLTGLPNSTALERVLRRRLLDRECTSVLLIDLDHFKTVNSTRGRHVGDLLLRTAAERIGEVIGEQGYLGRCGGDAFMVLLGGLAGDVETAREQAEETAGRLVERLREVYLLENGRIFSTPSIGIALSETKRPTDASELMGRAELAMYDAKAAGRDTTRFFDPGSEALLARRAGLELSLRTALEHQQIALHYQPFCDADGRIRSVEALARWHSAEFGLVSPTEFIPLAEDTGLILELGEQVLVQACDQLAAWSHDPFWSRIRVSVNISAHQFHQADFVDRVLQTVKHAGAEPAKLSLEVTEGVLLQLEKRDVVAKMRALRRHGVTFSLDDFGTGYSSLSYLKHLPLAQLKIDRSFVRDVTTGHRDSAIVETIITLGRTLGLEIVAEGVETAEQRDFLTRHGCHRLQGYLFARPTPVDELMRRFGPTAVARENSG